MMRRLLQPFWVLLAVIFLIEAWLWDHLEPIVARVVAWIPLRAFKAWLAERVDTLSPAMTLIVFIVPVLPLFPLKLVGLWLLANEYWASAVAMIIFAKFVGVGVTAFIFDVTRPKLLEMAWFEKLYEFIMALRAKAKGPGRADEAPHPRNAARRRRRLVGPHAPPDPALSQERARSAVKAYPAARARIASRASRGLSTGRKATAYFLRGGYATHHVPLPAPQCRCSRCGANRPSAVNDDPDNRQQAGSPGQHDHAGDDRGGRQHDADLERRRCHLEVVVSRGRKVALVLGMLGALRQLLGAFAGFRLGTIARRGLGPVVDLLLQRRLRGFVAVTPRLSLACSRWPAPRCGGCSWPGRTPRGSRPRRSC